MIAMDRFQAICYPMNNHFWQPSRSKLKIVIAWILGMVSHKKNYLQQFLVTKHFKQNFHQKIDIFQEQISTGSDFCSYLISYGKF